MKHEIKRTYLPTLKLNHTFSHFYMYLISKRLKNSSLKYHASAFCIVVIITAAGLKFLIISPFLLITVTPKRSNNFFNKPLN